MNSEIIKKKLDMKGISIYDVYLASGRKRNIYKAFEENKFSKKVIGLISGMLGEDLSIFINVK